MATSETRFLIDAGFIVAQAHKTFFGAPLMTAAGKDHTFTFGCVRDVLRVRQYLGIRAGVVVIGKEGYLISGRDKVLDLIAVLKELKIPHIHDAGNFALDVASRLRSKFSHILTADRRFLQFCAEDLIVVLPRREGKQTEWEWMSLDAMKTTMGIAPKDVPTYLALTDPSNASALTSKQAIRLIELYGNIDSIYKNLGQVMSARVRRNLAECESSIRQRYPENRCELACSHILSDKHCCLNDLDTVNNRKVLRKYGFHSLLTLLANPVDVRPDSRGRLPTSESYHAVLDRKGMEKLESVLCAAKLCSIDTESDEKDPREATLLGVSFSVKDGEAYFVPLVERDLKDLTRDDVLELLKRVFNSNVDFIGHNIKYDYLMLRRSGITMRRIHFDTMLAAYDCHGDWPFFSLPYVCKRYLGKEIKSYSDVVGNGGSFLDLPLREMVNHACQDADMTRRLYRCLLGELQKRSIAGQFFNHTMKHLQRLARLEFDGISVNVGQIDRIKADLLKRVTRLRLEICAMV
jgi:DNA polymerase I